MGMKARYKLLLMLTIAVVGVLVFGGQAWAAAYYAGNFRNPGYGVKADISTPASLPVVSGGVAFNFVGNYDSGRG